MNNTDISEIIWERTDWFIFVDDNFKEERKEMFYLTTHSIHFIYSYLASDIW